MVSESIKIRADSFLSFDLFVYIVVVIEKLASGFIRENAEVDVACKRIVVTNGETLCFEIGCTDRT